MTLKVILMTEILLLSQIFNDTMTMIIEEIIDDSNEIDHHEISKRKN